MKRREKVKRKEKKNRRGELWMERVTRRDRKKKERKKNFWKVVREVTSPLYAKCQDKYQQQKNTCFV